MTKIVDQNTRAYSAAHFMLTLDGVNSVGMFRSIEGGNIKADVMTYQSGGIYDRWRQLGKPHFEDLKLQVGMSMAQPFYKWIANFFTGVPDRKNGSIHAADFMYQERARRVFTNAMIKELTFPKLDATDKSAAYLGVGLSIEDMRFVAGDNHILKEDSKWQEQKMFTACNFRFKLDNFEDQCKRVSKVDSFTVKMNVLEYHAGGHRSPIKTPSQIDLPQLSFYVPEVDAPKFYQHVTDRIIKEKVDQPGRLNGYIETYDNENKPLFYLEFTNAEIVAVTPDKHDSTTEEIKQVKIDICVETMSFDCPRFNVE